MILGQIPTFVKKMKMRSLFLLLFLVFLNISLAAQSVYGPVDRRDAYLSGGGAVLFGGSIALTNTVTPLTPEEIRLLQDRRDRIWGVDRWVTGNWSPRAARVSDGLLFSSLALPLGLLADNSTRDHFGRHALIAFESLLINTALTQLTKTTVRRPRPYMYNPDVALPVKLKRSSQFSFFSGHTSIVSCMSFTSARMYNDLNPGSRWEPVVWSTAAIIPALTGYLRVRAGKHYVTDVLVGYGVGALVGLVVPRLHR